MQSRAPAVPVSAVGVHQPPQLQRSHCPAKLKLTSHLSSRGGHFESPLAANASHLSSSFSGRHSPATSASEGPRHWHSPAISGRHRSRLSFRGQVRSGLFGIASHPRFSPASPATGRCLRCLGFRATSQAAATSPQQAPALGSAAATEVPRGKAASSKRA